MIRHLAKDYDIVKLTFPSPCYGSDNGPLGSLSIFGLFTACAATKGGIFACKKVPARVSIFKIF